MFIFNRISINPESSNIQLECLSCSQRNDDVVGGRVASSDVMLVDVSPSLLSSVCSDNGR